MMDQKLVYHLAHKFTNNGKFLLEDLVSEANLAYLEALPKFDESRGIQFATFGYRVIYNHLLNYVKKESRFISTTSEAEVAEIHPVPFVELIEELSTDAKEVVEFIILNVEEFDGMAPRLMRGIIRKLLMSTGWSNRKVTKTLNELKVKFK